MSQDQVTLRFGGDATHVLKVMQNLRQRIKTETVEILQESRQLAASMQVQFKKPLDPMPRRRRGGSLGLGGNDGDDIGSPSLKGLKGMMGAIRAGGLAGGLMSIFNIVDGITDQINNFIQRGKELGKWWGAFSVGGLKAVEAMQAADRAAENFFQTGKKLKKQREEFEEVQKDARSEEFAKSSLTKQAQMLQEDRLKITKEIKEEEEEILKKTGGRLTLEDKTWKLMTLEEKLKKKHIEHESKLKEIKEEQFEIEQKSNSAVLKMNEEIERKQQRQIELSKQAINELRNVGEMQQDLRRTKEDRSRFTLSELAAANPRQFSGNLRQQAVTADQVVFLEDRAENLRKRGFFKESQRDFNKADELRKGMVDLVDAERNPFRSQEEAIKKSQEHLADLVKKANDGAFKVTISGVEE